jgi:undecaprenyl-diphosphatase
MVCPEAACRVPDFDRNGLAAMSELRRPWLDTVMTASTWLGSLAVLLPGAAAMGAWQWRRGRSGDAFLLVAAVCGAAVIAHAGKLLVARPRPDMHAALVSMPPDLSFPSAHTLQIAAFASAWVLAAHPRPAAAVAAAVAIALVAFSRVYLQVHYPSDVAVAVVAGAAWAAGLRLLLDARA